MSTINYDILLRDTDNFDAGFDNAGPPAKLHEAKSLLSRYKRQVQRLMSEVSDLQMLSAQALAEEDFQATVVAQSTLQQDLTKHADILHDIMVETGDTDQEATQDE